MALAQIDVACEELEGEESGAVSELAVHETRKALKRLRALLRLLAHRLPDGRFAHENAALRDLARRLAGARDAAVMLGTLDALIERHPRKLAARRGVIALRARLLAEHQRARRGMLADLDTRRQTLGELRAFRLRVLAWDLNAAEGVELAAPGLRRIYSQGRARYERAERGMGNRVRTMHEWRKRVKDLRYAAEMLELRDTPPAGSAAAAQGARSGTGELRRLADRAERLGEVLGDEHDLAVLADSIRSRSARGTPKTDRIGRGSSQALLQLIARRRRKLRRRALREGERLYRRSPKRLEREIRRARPIS